MAPINHNLPLSILWCMHCLRAAIDGIFGHFPAFQINCRCNTRGYGTCIRCINHNEKCERPAEGMRGDAYDLSAILNWASSFWQPRDKDSMYPVWGTKFKETVNEASINLAKAFESAERQHRIHHQLVNMPGCELRFKEYQLYLSDRTRAYPNPLQRPRVNDSEEIWDRYTCECGQRLRDGDPGHTTWSVAKHDYIRNVQQAVVDYSYSTDFNQLRMWREDIADTFPITLQDI